MVKMGRYYVSGNESEKVSFKFTFKMSTVSQMMTLLAIRNGPINDANFRIGRVTMTGQRQMKVV